MIDLRYFPVIIELFWKNKRIKKYIRAWVFIFDIGSQLTSSIAIQLDLSIWVPLANDDAAAKCVLYICFMDFYYSKFLISFTVVFISPSSVVDRFFFFFAPLIKYNIYRFTCSIKRTVLCLWRLQDEMRPLKTSSD